MLVGQWTNRRLTNPICPISPNFDALLFDYSAFDDAPANHTLGIFDPFIFVVFFSNFMCGRYRRTTSEEELARLYHIPIPTQPDLPKTSSSSLRPADRDVPGELRVAAGATGRERQEICSEMRFDALVLMQHSIARATGKHYARSCAGRVRTAQRSAVPLSAEVVVGWLGK